MNMASMACDMAVAGATAEQIAAAIRAVQMVEAPVEVAPEAPVAPVAARPGQAERVADFVANALKTHQVFTWEQAKETTGVRRTKRLIALMEEAITGGSAVVVGKNGRYALVPGTEGHQAFLTHMGYPEDRIPKR